MPKNVHSTRPVCVDADGELVRSDLVLECLVEVARQPKMLWRMPGWAVRGRGFFKRKLAEHAKLDVGLLPYEVEKLEKLKARAGGENLRLVTRADEQIARQVAGHLGLSQDVVASSPAANLPSAGKRAALDRKYTPGGYDYIAATAAAPSLQQVVRLLRPYQWLKNALVFLPFILAHHLRQPDKWLASFLAFFAFSLTASTGYVVNDILDRAQDRQHHRKRFRPVASGAISLRWALWLTFLPAGLAAACCAFLPWQCSVLMVGYLGASFFYSAVAKNRLMADVILLSLLYTSRLLMGSTATHNVVSPWLLGFSLTLFLSLALCKRVSELITRRAENKEDSPGRKYRAEDIPVLEMMAVASGFLACLIMVLYIQSSEILRLYHNPQYLWFGAVSLLYWIGRLIIFTHRGKCPDDPLFFVLQDKVTMMLFCAAAFFGYLAI